jgi:hypothetical protein
MVATYKEYNQILSNAQGRQFSLLEACEFMEFIDNTFPIGLHQINWIDSKTKKPVAIGYNPSPKKFTTEKKDNKRKCGIPEIRGKVMRTPYRQSV